MKKMGVLAVVASAATAGCFSNPVVSTDKPSVPPPFRLPNGALMALKPAKLASTSLAIDNQDTFGSWTVVTTEPVELLRMSYRVKRSSNADLKNLQFLFFDPDYQPEAGRYAERIYSELFYSAGGGGASYNAYEEFTIKKPPVMRKVGKEYLIKAIGEARRAAIGSTISVDLDIIVVTRRSTGEEVDPKIPAAEGETLTLVAP